MEEALASHSHWLDLLTKSIKHELGTDTVPPVFKQLSIFPELLAGVWGITREGVVISTRASLSNKIHVWASMRARYGLATKVEDGIQQKDNLPTLSRCNSASHSAPQVASADSSRRSSPRSSSADLSASSSPSCFSASSSLSLASSSLLPVCTCASVCSAYPATMHRTILLRQWAYNADVTACSLAADPPFTRSQGPEYFSCLFAALFVSHFERCMSGRKASSCTIRTKKSSKSGKDKKSKKSKKSFLAMLLHNLVESVDSSQVITINPAPRLEPGRSAELLPHYDIAHKGLVELSFFLLFLFVLLSFVSFLSFLSSYSLSLSPLLFFCLDHLDRFFFFFF